jgi:hypothetical protein
MTRAVIAAIPPEGAGYRPHADSRSAFELAWHIVSAEIKYLDAIAAGVFPHDLKPTPDAVRKPSDVLAWYTERFDPAMRRLETTTGDELLRMVDFYGAPDVSGRRSASADSQSHHPPSWTVVDISTANGREGTVALWSVV